MTITPNSKRPGIARRIGDATLRFLGSLYHARFGDLVRGALPFVIGAIAILHEYGHLKGAGWMYLWLSMFALLQLSDVYLQGRAKDRTNSVVDQVHGSFAGSIDSLTQRIIQSRARCLSEEASKALCVGLLARIRKFAEHRLAPGDGNPIRVTLSVPLFEGSGVHEKATALRTWCYDESYPDRRWTTIPIDLEGAPKAYATGTIQVIDDLMKLDRRADDAERPYRSIASLPVRAGGPAGRTLAVVNIDAAEPNFLTLARVKKVLPIIAPAINVIALVLLTRDNEAAYAFHS